MKKRITAAIGLMLAAGLVAGGSIAYFTSDDSETMEFRAAAYDPDDPQGYDDPDDVFSIVVDEQDVNAPEYDPDHPETNPRTEEGNEYRNMQPGDIYVKDPTVHNTGKYPQYVRMKLQVTDVGNWNAACAKYGLPDLDFHTVPLFLHGFNMDFADRAVAVYDEGEDKYEYTYYLNRILQPGQSATLFDGVVIPSEFNRDEAVLIQQFDVRVTADAIQADNLELAESSGNADSAYEAFEKYWTNE